MAVQFLGRVELVTKRRKDEVRVRDGSTLSDLLTTLAEKYGSRFKIEVFDPVKGSLRSEFVVMVNRTILEDLNAPLKEGDAVVVMPVMSGG